MTVYLALMINNWTPWDSADAKMDFYRTLQVIVLAIPREFFWVAFAYKQKLIALKIKWSSSSKCQLGVYVPLRLSLLETSA